MYSTLSTFILDIGLAIIIGAIQDLPRKHYIWFIGRIAFMAVIAVISNLMIYKTII